MFENTLKASSFLHRGELTYNRNASSDFESETSLKRKFFKRRRNFVSFLKNKVSRKIVNFIPLEEIFHALFGRKTRGSETL